MGGEDVAYILVDLFIILSIHPAIFFIKPLN